MTRYRLTLEYDGTPFVGWQRQSEGVSIQHVVEEAVFKFCGERATVYAAGRMAFVAKGDSVVAHGGRVLEELVVPFVRIRSSEQNKSEKKV